MYDRLQFSLLLRFVYHDGGFPFILRHELYKLLFKSDLLMIFGNAFGDGTHEEHSQKEA